MNSQSSDQFPHSEQFMLRVEVMDAFIVRVWLDEGRTGLDGGDDNCRVMAELSCPRCESGLGVVDCSKARYIKCNECNQLCRISV